MEINEFISQKNDLRIEHDKKVQALSKEYALSNNTVKVGDMVTDHIGAVKVEKILIRVTDEPSCVYSGTEYTKAGKPTKRGTKRLAYQINLVNK